MKCNILVVEDELRLRRILKSYFEEENWLVYEAGNGLVALDILEKVDVDIVVLDIMMPLMDGMETIKKIRSKYDINVIMLTALTDEESEIQCYKYGADDFIQKPFKSKVLVAKIKRILEKRDATMISDEHKHKNFKIDYLSRKVFIAGEELFFSPREFDLLEYLVRHKDIVKTREQIIENVWGIDFEGETRVVDRHILKLRNKLNYKFVRIETVISKGYRYEEI